MPRRYQVNPVRCTLRYVHPSYLRRLENSQYRRRSMIMQHSSSNYLHKLQNGFVISNTFVCYVVVYPIFEVVPLELSICQPIRKSCPVVNSNCTSLWKNWDYLTVKETLPYSSPVIQILLHGIGVPAANEHELTVPMTHSSFVMQLFAQSFRTIIQRFFFAYSQYHVNSETSRHTYFM